MKPRRYTIEVIYGDDGLSDVRTSSDHDTQWSSYDPEEWPLELLLGAVAKGIEEEEVLLKLCF